MIILWFPVPGSRFSEDLGVRFGDECELCQLPLGIFTSVDWSSQTRLLTGVNGSRFLVLGEFVNWIWVGRMVPGSWLLAGKMIGMKCVKPASLSKFYEVKQVIPNPPADG